ncbi:MAG: ATP-binding protein [Candidatus Dormibacteria bacterium]
MSTIVSTPGGAQAYRPRVVDLELRTRLAAVGAVLMEGPKACGKTETARRVVASEVRLDVDAAARQAAAIDPSLVLGGPVPRLLDEWQVVPALWNHVRRAVDDRQEPGQFVLTGSAVPADESTRHAGAGRFARLRMRPMSLFESGDGDAAVSLAGLLAGAAPSAAGEGVNLQRLAELIARGGWPANLRLALPHAMQANIDYLGELSRLDISRVDGVKRDPARAQRLFASIARNVATEATISTIARDSSDGAGAADWRVAASYLTALERLMVVEDAPAWAPHLRSKARLRTAATRHFVDPALAVAALGAGPSRLLADLNYLGLLFESLAVRDLRVYAQASLGRVAHFRDSNGLEVDAVVECADGRWAAFEVKLGGEEAVNRAAASLVHFAATVDSEKRGPPAALVVVTGVGGYAYVRPDGVAIVPLVRLGP